MTGGFVVATMPIRRQALSLVSKRAHTTAVRRYLRGKYVHRHKGKPQRQHRFPRFKKPWRPAILIAA